MAPSIDEIVIADPPDAWTSAGFSVDADGVAALGTVRVRLVGRDAGKRILSWSFRDLDEETGQSLDGGVDGLATAASDRPPAEPAVHANGTRLIDHVVVLSPDHQRSIEAFRAIGFEPRRTRETDSYGAPFLQTFFRAGEVILELIGPEEPSGDDPASFFGLALTVDDLDATKRYFGEAMGEIKDAVQPGRRIATLRHRELGMSVATAFMSPGPGAIDGSGSS